MTTDGYELGVLDGDGIGPEIVRATTAVLTAAAERTGLPLKLHPAPVGWRAYRESGTTLPKETIDLLTRCAGWLVGPTSAGEYPADDPVNGHPSGFMRRHFELFANIRPVHSWPQLPTKAPELDVTIIRENTEGFYPDRNLYWGYGEFLPTPDVAISLRVITKRACDRIARLTFEYARTKGLPGFVVVHKRTSLKQTDGMFIESFEQLRPQYPDVAVEYMRVDTFSSTLISQPGRFQLVVTTNLFGDIISDQACGLVGGVGLAPSLNAGAEHAMAQAVHGTAPDIAGQGIANPAALILSAGLLLDWLARRHDDPTCAATGAAVNEAVEHVLISGISTADIGGTATTEEFTEAVVGALHEQD